MGAFERGTKAHKAAWQGGHLGTDHLALVTQLNRLRCGMMGYSGSIYRFSTEYYTLKYNFCRSIHQATRAQTATKVIPNRNDAICGPPGKDAYKNALSDESPTRMRLKEVAIIPEATNAKIAFRPYATKGLAHFRHPRISIAW